MTAFMARERDLVRKHFPDLLDYLDSTPLMDMEGPDSKVIDQFRSAGGTKLTIPAEAGGLGASALDVVRIQRVFGSRSPSLGAGTTMHHLSLATLHEFSQSGSDDDRALVKSLVDQNAIVASGFSEGVTGGSVFVPTMKAVRTGDVYVINGSKKPCSLSRSMDLLTASVEVDTGERAIALIPAALPGISVREFWTSPILAGAESEEVVLENVEVPADLVLLNGEDDPDGETEMTGYLWFGMLVAASYLGAASNLLERVLAAGKNDYEGYVRAAADVEAGMGAIEAIARAVDDGERGEDISVRLLLARISIREALVRATASAVETLGGINFIRNPEIGYLASAIHAFAFHPPSRRTISETLQKYHQGEPFAFL
ncbi:oxidoreductase [Rhodococcoides trifolii]|uniref:Oxidoreductase n=1 Tax=Rhodococcoides trifolii TaxID=908250 RepID=A0A917CPT8_9NOCA|nr:acyl-CoA dehydrogenase family protein [Rhodococcus trifolii]GGF95170.1 oxidoreductase [Rhodococcus trifolii]